MKISRQPAGLMAALALTLALILNCGFTDMARAASEDVAMFYDELSQYGQWAEYENYGPVWRPSQVPENWRPYTNGRWVPTNNGYVFETQEPWGWATYHYGNWMPTQGYGWVWVPGRTWYPSTVEWRTSPENTPPNDAYVGWAPIPPPNYVPPPAYAAPGYSPGNPIVNALTAPFWVFAKAVSFLLGLGQPYAPAYSYVNAGVLVPPSYVQVFYPQTVMVRRYYTPAYYPPAYFRGRRLAFAAYNWGPPPAYLYRAARINRAVFNRSLYRNSAYIARLHSVVPPRRVINRYRYVKQIMPPALTRGRALPPPRRVKNYRLAQTNLYKPNVLPAPRQVPALKKQFPKVQPVAGFQPGHSVRPMPQARHGKVMPGGPASPTVRARPGRVQPGRTVPGEFRRKTPRHHKQAVQPRTRVTTSGYRPPKPKQQKQYRSRTVRQQQVQRQRPQKQSVPRYRHQKVTRQQQPRRVQKQYQRGHQTQARPPRVQSQQTHHRRPQVQRRPQPRQKQPRQNGQRHEQP